MLRMSEPLQKQKRLIESKLGVLIGALLALLWIASMSVVDAHASSFVPASWLLAVVVSLAFFGVALGYKVVRLSLTAWLGIAVGCYFLVRCMAGPSLVESWKDEGLILGGFVFYLSGIYYGQARSSNGFAFVLGLAVLLNLVALWLMGETELSIRYLGRPEMALTGPMSRNTTLLVYKNFAGLMLSLCGVLLIWFAVWKGRSLRSLLCFLLGVVGVVGAFFCKTRVVFLVAPLLLAFGSLIWVLKTIFSRGKLSWIQCILAVLILIGLSVFVADCFMERSILDAAWGVESHVRFLIWSEAWPLIGDAPIWGYGASSAQWLMAPTYKEFHLPNYIHNDFLEGWVGYGIIGAGLMLAVIVVHILKGVRALASEHVSDERKTKTALAILCVVGISAAAMTDFVWHNFSLVCLTAFACGMMASPFPRPAIRWFDFRHWAPESRNRAVPLRAESGPLKVLLLMGGLALGLLIVGLSQELFPGWKAQWKYDSMTAEGRSLDERRVFLLQTIPQYPDSRIGDHYVLAGAGSIDWPAYEQALRVILHHNPRQIFTATMLADVLGRQGKFEEAELVFRRSYRGDGPNANHQGTWPVYYATNLFAWGQQMLSAGQREIACSMMQHAEDITKGCGRLYPNIKWDLNGKNWSFRASAERQSFISRCKTDLSVLKSIGVQPDHSWKAPMEPSGKPALYLRYEQEN